MGASDETITGGCHCGAIRYVITGAIRRNSLCHCHDCRRCAGAVSVGWASVPRAALSIAGETAAYHSTGDVVRRFCPRCGTGLFYESESLFPGLVDVQSATFDDPAAFAPTERIQLAEAPAWLARMHLLPGYLRFPD